MKEYRSYPSDHIQSSHEQRLHNKGIIGMELISDSDDYVLTACKDKTVVMSKIPLATSKEPEIRLTRSFEGFNGNVSSLAHTSDSANTFFAASSYDGIVRLFNSTSTTPLRLYSTSKSPIRTVALSADCKYLITGNTGRDISIFDVETKKELTRYSEKNGGHSGWVNDIKILQNNNPNELVFVSASEDTKIKIWFVSSFMNNNTEEKSDRVNVLSAHKEAVTCLAVSKCRKYLASGGRDKKVVVFDITSPTEVKVLKEFSTSDKVYSVDFSPIDSNKLVVGNGEVVEIFDLRTEDRTGACLPSTFSSKANKFSENEVGAVKFDKEGKSVVVGYNDGFVARYVVE
eukprot:GAHX01000378.1.p1 GENE.GAHX01000378.1~~GAHX01000378.1.p1  ORF type:complete len:344 (-),score=64.69 GAHX01000378.1:39-1070(-)